MYRKNIGIIIINKEKKIFLGKRINFKNLAWQMPQGGSDSHEEHIETLFREIKEEIGTTNVVIIKEFNQWIKYNFPKNKFVKKNSKQIYKGQKQKWFLLQFLGKDTDIKLRQKNQEFNSWKWTNIYEITKELISFKKKTYYIIRRKILFEIETI